MKKIYIALTTLGLILSAPFFASAAQPPITTFQGGTGSTSPSGLLYGDGSIGLKSVTPGSNCTFVGGTFNCTGGAAGAGGSNTQVQFNDAGSLSGNANFTFDKTTGLVTMLTASSTRLSVYGPAYFGATATSSFSSAGALTLITPLLIGSGGTGVNTFTSSQLVYGNGTNALTSVATSTLTASSPLSLDQPVVKVGGTNSILSISTSGTWSGNAGTATALAANGTNCSAGNYPLGVDASGNVESCTAANLGTVTSVGLSSTNSTLTIGATPVTGSGTITADLNLGHANAWTALQSFALSSTTLASITSKLYVGGTATTTIDSAGNIVIPSGSNLTVTGKSDGCATWATGVLNSTGSACGSGGGGSGTVGTSTNETAGFLSYWTTTSATPALLGKIATTTLGFSGPFNGYASIGTLVGGSNTTITWTGLATTSQPSSSNLLVSNGGAGVYGVATSTLTASSPLTGSFTQVGSGGSLGCTNASSGVTGCLTGTDWNTFNGKLGSYDAWTHTAVWGITPLSATSTTLSLTGNTFALIASSTLEVSSSTGPQLFINDAGTSNPWFLRAVNGNFYLGTSTVGNATSSVAAISIVQGATGANATTTSSFMDWVFKHTSKTAFSIMDAFGSTVLNVNTASTTGPIFAVQATTTDHAILFSVDQYGHLTASSTPGVPTVSSCGTGSPSVTAGSSDSVGSVTTGTGSPTACTITFNRAFTSAPVVLLEDTSTAVTVDISSISTTAFTISMSAGLTSTKIYWFAIQGASTL